MLSPANQIMELKESEMMSPYLFVYMKQSLRTESTRIRIDELLRSNEPESAAVPTYVPDLITGSIPIRWCEK